MTTGTATTAKKSGIKTLAPGEILFNEGDNANSMYIIQKGQLRLFRPKGKGFVEIAVLRAGEVLGEMAYFDPDTKNRSVSAAAITSVDIIEISFNALEKTMAGLNPWFKTLINTLAERLRKTNERVRNLENNSVGFSSDYKFFQSADVVKILSVLFLTFRSLGENKEGRWYLNYNRIKTYALEIFNINEAKMEEFIQLLTDEQIIEVTVDDQDASKVLSTREPDTFRMFQVFFNTQRSLRDEKKLHISSKCEKFMVRVMEECSSLPIVDGKVDIELSKIVSHFKEYNLGITLDDFQGAKNAKFCGEYRMGENNSISSTINIDYMRKMYPVVRFMNALNRVNELKAKA
ncbi:cyclic nucleotide-binding domain-containing protein [Bacteriovorax sp. PP10]|uniref:Cyclic nucleotide-binding domain-containing protein n=1 Tax=Bacteriovorax antarcticus TaxID=3088717 RepID=A0ABU5VR79_9BACT|nr:cyclic nucleotide-binding domain-containing protein [Bacteriovorax sp. PP10]MEA9355552.1 cyclic nucleotide-binding domain-containing protein [Bacteriovorax sp. PP10]